VIAALFLSLFLEIPVTPPSYMSAAGTQGEPSVASNGESFFAAWSDGRDANGVYGTRLAADGHALDPTGIFLGSGAHPKVIWNGRNWLVLIADPTTARITATAVNRDGRVVAPAQVIASAAAVVYGTQYAATNGSKTVVAYLRYDGLPFGSIEVAVLDEEGAPLAGNIRLPFTPALNHFGISIASNGDGFFVQWFVINGANNGVEGVRLDANGFPADATPILIHSTGFIGDAPAIYSDGHDYLFAGRLNDGTNTLFRRINADGSLGTRIAQPRSSPLLAWTGDRYVMLYGDASQYAFRALDRDGHSIDQGATVYVASDQTPNAFAMAANGTSIMLVWSQSDIVSMPVDARTYTPSPPSIIALTATPQEAYAIAAGGNGFAIAWQEQPATPRVDSYVARVDASGDPISVTRVKHGNISTINPRLAWNGSSYDVAFLEANSIITNRLAENGTLLDGPGNTVSPATCANDLDVASSGDVTLLAWSDCTSGKILGLRLRNGQPLDSLPLTISQHAANFATEVHPRAAWNGSAFVVVWQDRIPRSSIGAPIPSNYGEIHAVRVTPQLQLLDFFPIEISASGNSSEQPEIASSGLESLVVYSRNGWIEARLFANDGTLSAPIATKPSTLVHASPSVTWNHGSYFVAWQETWFPRSDILGARVTRLGTISPSIPLAASSTKPLLATGSGGQLMMLYDRVATEPLYGGVMRAFLRLLDTPRLRAAGR